MINKQSNERDRNDTNKLTLHRSTDQYTSRHQYKEILHRITQNCDKISFQ